MATSPLNREAWLNRLAEMLRPWFRDAGYPIHGRISVGMATMKGKLGFCQSSFNKEANMCHIFISAYEDGEMADPVGVGAVLVHELAHAVIPRDKTPHGKLFQEAAKKLKFGQTAKGSWHTTAQPELKAHLEKLIAELPPLPRYGVTETPRRVVTRDRDMSIYRFQCGTCRTTVTMKYTSLKRAGPPPCWNEECDAYGIEMVEQDNREIP